MKNHLAYNRMLEELDIAIVDDSKFQQQLMRTILQPLRLKRLRFFDTAKNALTAIRQETPHLLIMDWRLEGMSGRKLITALRHQNLGMAAFVPVLVIMEKPKRCEAEEAFRAGAQAVIAKPLSQNALQRRIQWITRDARPLKLSGQQFIIDGVDTALQEKPGMGQDKHGYKVISEEELSRKSNGLEKAVA